MTSRERIMIYALGAMLLGGVGYVAYTMFVKPIRAQNQQIAELNDQIGDREQQLEIDRRNNKRIASVLPLTLPANRELVKAEYETLLVKLFRESKISGYKYGEQTQSDTDPEPELVPGVNNKGGKKAYTKVIYKIDFEKVTLAKVTHFLERFHAVPLMHQVVKCIVKHAPGNNATAALKLKADERNDLSVSLVVEAVLMDGAPDRKTLLAIPDGFGAALGGAGLFALNNDTEKSRGLIVTPAPDAAYVALAEVKRDYDLLQARDPFHGPLPPIPPDPEKPKRPDSGEPKKVDPPPYDSTPYTYLSSLVRTDDAGKRTARADIVDRFYDQFFTVEFSQFGDLFEVKVLRFTRETKTDSKTKEVSSVFKRDYDHPTKGQIFELADRASKVVRTFKIYGLVGNTLLLGEKEKVEAPKEEKGKRPAGKQPGGKVPAGKVPAGKAPNADAVAAGVGGLAVLKPVEPVAKPVEPAEKFYRWNVSSLMPLSEQMRPLSEKEAKEALALAAMGLRDQPTPPPLPPPLPPKEKVLGTEPGAEVAPTPRPVLN